MIELGDIAVRLADGGSQLLDDAARAEAALPFARDLAGRLPRLQRPFCRRLIRNLELRVHRDRAEGARLLAEAVAIFEATCARELAQIRRDDANPALAHDLLERATAEARA